MNEENNTRQRFCKPSHLLAGGSDRPMNCLREIFRSFHLEEFREELICWKDRALCNTAGSYEGAHEREDLIDFCQECLKLVEALFLVQKKSRKKWRKGLSKEALAIIKRADQLELLSKEEQANPQVPIRRFCKMFTPAYAKIELLDLLEAVVTYKGVKPVYKGHLIFFYQCMEYLITHAFQMCKGKK